jgi:hypothetical protein
MPTQRMVIRVFVAAPSDVEEERLALEQVVKELNLTWADSLGLQVDLVQWRTHATPGVGTDPQQVINEQIGNSYDIFLGLMWTRFGTQTPRAESGTEEEFKRALARHEADPDSVDVMFYFKTSTPSDLDAIDTDQLAAVRRFRTRIGPEGVLYWTFQAPEEFQSLLRIHLGRKAQAWRDKLAAPATAESPRDATRTEENAGYGLTTDLDEDAELGLMELQEMYDSAFSELAEITGRMAGDITNLGQRFEERNVELKAITPANTPQRKQAAKRIVKRAAGDLEQYVQRTRVELPLFAASLTRAIDSYGKALSITTDFGVGAADQIRSSLEGIATLRASIGGASEGADGLRATIAGWPRMSTDLIAAKKKGAAVLGDIVKECQSADRLLAEVTASMREWLDKSP